MEAKHTRVNALRPVHGRGEGVRAWLVWQLPHWLIAFIGVVVLADAALLAVAASRLTIHRHDLWLFGCLLVCSAATVELTRQAVANTMQHTLLSNCMTRIILPPAAIQRSEAGETATNSRL